MEDEPLISMMLEDWLAELGHEVAGTAETLASAVQMAGQLQYDAAILDMNLRSKRSDSVAEIFRARDIPFAVSSGSPDGYADPAFQGAPTMGKPFSYETVQATVSKLVSKQSKHVAE